MPLPVVGESLIFGLLVWAGYAIWMQPWDFLIGLLKVLGFLFGISVHKVRPFPVLSILGTRFALNSRNSKANQTLHKELGS